MLVGLCRWIHPASGHRCVLSLVYFNFFSMWPFLVMCGTMGYLFHIWGGVGVGLFLFFFFCDKYLY